MSDRFRELKEATAAALLRRPGASPPELRQACARGEAPDELLWLEHAGVTFYRDETAADPAAYPRP